MKTKRAQVTFKAGSPKITCTTHENDKDVYGKSIWYDEHGNAYELSYARHARIWAFIPYPYYNK